MYLLLICYEIFLKIVRQCFTSNLTRKRRLPNECPCTKTPIKALFISKININNDLFIHFLDDIKNCLFFVLFLNLRKIYYSFKEYMLSNFSNLSCNLFFLPIDVLHGVDRMFVFIYVEIYLSTYYTYNFFLHLNVR